MDLGIWLPVRPYVSSLLNMKRMAVIAAVVLTGASVGVARASTLTEAELLYGDGSPAGCRVATSPAFVDGDTWHVDMSLVCDRGASARFVNRRVIMYQDNTGQIVRDVYHSNLVADEPFISVGDFYCTPDHYGEMAKVRTVAKARVRIEGENVTASGRVAEVTKLECIPHDPA